MPESSFGHWFTTLTGHSSLRYWQETLGDQANCRSLLIRIPTGLGKTEGVLTAWSFHRISRNDDRWPRRLIWCLPMRVLVEQTEQVARQLVAKMPVTRAPEVHLAMGGEDFGEWFLYPERPAIIIGTQDMLISRALNRGYASPRARWPMEFGLLNQDALWVMDEVQLMDVGLATSAQLQAFREQDGKRSLRPCHTWWMSATLQPEWLKSVDTVPHHFDWTQQPCTVVLAKRKGDLWDIHKPVTTKAIDPEDDKAFARQILAEHDAILPGQYGRITLVVCNTVHRACRTYNSLRYEGRFEGLELVHSRFRPFERERWPESFLSRSACTAEVDRIIVATQVVEAGVDLSAGCVITELAPWPSLVQRFGRCARYGGAGHVLVIDRRGSNSEAAPYRPEELESAWESIQTLRDVGIAVLETYEESLTPEARKRLYPFEPAHLLMRREFDELFDTTPDLTGADADISRFIRSGNERDIQVFWLNLAKSEEPSAKRRAQRRELCAVPFLRVRDWLCGKETKENRKQKLRGRMRAWVWDWIDGKWVDAARASLWPGRVVCVAAACGGYRTDFGFDPESTNAVPIVPSYPPPPDAQALDEADDQQDGENLSFTSWKTIACHGSEVAEEAEKIVGEIHLPDAILDILVNAGRWHDWGKCHPAFQGAMRRSENRPARCDLAKAPEEAWLRPPSRMYRYEDGSDERPGFRHELASALGLFALLEMYAPHHRALLGPWRETLTIMGRSFPVRDAASPETPLVQQILDYPAEAFDLLAYLVASHHGKVRVALHASPKDQDYRDRDGRGLPVRGVREADRLPSVVLTPGLPPLPAVPLTLSLAAIGLSERTGISWRERCLGLVERFGPAGLAFLESLLRAADIRASRLKTNDPALVPESRA
jgi:CRISPR-associated endonuclease/helicase Cas3